MLLHVFQAWSWSTQGQLWHMFGPVRTPLPETLQAPVNPAKRTGLKFFYLLIFRTKIKPGKKWGEREMERG